MTVWTSAFTHGTAAADDVLDAMKTWAELHEVTAADAETADRLDLPYGEQPATGLVSLLGALRKAEVESADLALPVAGDVRGLGGSGDFTHAALRQGQAVTFGSASLGLVPENVADGILRWTVYPTALLPPAEHLPISEAEHGMSSAMREAASTLVDLDIARHRPGVRQEIAETVASRPQPMWPESVPPRALRVLQRAAEVEVILWVATEDAPGGALSASAIEARVTALRPLFDSVRAARTSAVAEMVRAVSASTV